MVLVPSWGLMLLVAYCGFIVLASLGGGWLPFLVNLTHTRMQLMLSLVGGLMLGIGLFHMLPHAVAEMGAGSLDRAVMWMMIGLLTTFFLIRTFHFHQHGPVETSAESEDDPTEPHDHGRQYGHGHGHNLSWIGVTFGLALHTLIDGMALAASVQAAAGHESGWSLWGLGTFLAILLHKPLDAVSITTLMVAGRWSAPWRHAVNAGFAMMCPFGAAMFLLGVERFAEHQHLLVGCGLAFAAGVFVCISLGDLLPEVEFHAHDRIWLSALLVLGIAAAYALNFLEPEHAHPDTEPKTSSLQGPESRVESPEITLELVKKSFPRRAGPVMALVCPMRSSLVTSRLTPAARLSGPGLTAKVGEIIP